MTWAVSTKGEQGGRFEVCAEVEPHTPSWGWYGSRKIQVEGMGFEEAKLRAQIICDALNAAEVK